MNARDDNSGIDVPVSAELERELRALTAVNGLAGAGGGLWTRALEQEAPARRGPSLTGKRIAGLVGAMLCCVLVVAMLVPALGKARSRAWRTEASASAASGRVAEAARKPSDSSVLVGSLRVGKDFQSGSSEKLDDAAQPELDSSGAIGERAKSLPAARMVSRKASIDLGVENVRDAFVRAQFLLSDVGGEFVEDSSITGEGVEARADLKLRVRAERLATVLEQLRALGTVAREAINAEDVTDQVVDIEARLINERRVEKELLDLLSSRKDAPLKDVLELRTQLAGVRQSIERMVASRDRLGALVSLSSVLVTIRHESTLKAPPIRVEDHGLWSYAKASFRKSWEWSLKTLADTVAGFIAIAVGGLVWWVIFSMVGVLVWRWIKRSRRAAAIEPPPNV